MEYKALIWGSGEAFVKASASIFREVDKGHLKIIGVVGNDLEYRKFYGYTYYPKSEVKNLEFDLVIVCSSDNSLSSIYKEGTSLGIPRDKFLRGSVFSLINFDLIKYMLLRENPVSLISICCCGGKLYDRLDLPFYSPTIKMFFSSKDLSKMTQNLPYYLSQKLQFKEWSNIGDSRFWPIMTLDDIELNFMHYYSIEEASDSWYKRSKRINYNNILVITYAETEEELECFDLIPYRKVCFTTTFKSSMKDTFYLPQNGNAKYTKYSSMYMVNHLADGVVAGLDPLKLLLGEKDFMMCSYW